MTRKIN